MRSDVKNIMRMTCEEEYHVRCSSSCVSSRFLHAAQLVQLSLFVFLLSARLLTYLDDLSLLVPFRDSKRSYLYLSEYPRVIMKLRIAAELCSWDTLGSMVSLFNINLEGASDERKKRCRETHAVVPRLPRLT